MGAEDVSSASGSAVGTGPQRDADGFPDWTAASGPTKLTATDGVVLAADAEDGASPPPEAYNHPDWIKSCKRIFLDLGAGKGINVERMFEPKRFKGHILLPHLDSELGAAGWRRAAFNKTGVCALGLEPNSQHFAALQGLEAHYAEKGWRAHFYPFAAWNEEGWMAFNGTSPRRCDDCEDTVGSHLAMKDGQQIKPPGDDDEAQAGDQQQQQQQQPRVRTVDLAAFIQSLPAGSVKLMLMDIEGAEYETLAQLMQMGAFCRGTIGKALLEAHQWGQIEHWGDVASFPKGVHPRSFDAVRNRVQELSDFHWCKPSKVTHVEEFSNDSEFLSIAVPSDGI